MCCVVCGVTGCILEQPLCIWCRCVIAWFTFFKRAGEGDWWCVEPSDGFVWSVLYFARGPPNFLCFDGWRGEREPPPRFRVFRVCCQIWAVGLIPVSCVFWLLNSAPLKLTSTTLLPEFLGDLLLGGKAMDYFGTEKKKNVGWLV